MRIGQKEDPDFTFRVMVVQVLWPGATVEEMQDQVVDKIERKLQETPGLDFVRSYTRPGFANIFVNLKGRCAARRSRTPSIRRARRSATFARRCPRA